MVAIPTAVRERAAERLRDMCVVYIHSEGAQDEYGRTIDVFTPAADPLPCRYGPLSGREAEIAGALGVRADGALHLEPLETLREQDEVVVTLAETEAIHHVRVEYIKRRSHGILLSALCVEVT